jgi:pentatricopeptide repeat protein
MENGSIIKIIKNKKQMEEDLQRLIQRLEDEKDTLNPRVKKRIFQKIGKLKKKQAEQPSKNNVSSQEVVKKRKPEGNEQTVSNTADLSNVQKKQKLDTETVVDMKIRDEEPKKPSVSDATKITEMVVDDDEEDTERQSFDDVQLPVVPKKVSKKEMKALIHLLNKQLREFAVKKQLNRAKKLFQQFINKGHAPDIHAYSSLLNVYIRCQDITNAKRLFEEIERNPSLKVNQVTYTILLKGYCENGLMEDACHLYFEKMVKENLCNIRSLNTFLRGCLRTGMHSSAVKAFQAFHSSSSSKATAVKDGNDSENDENEDEMPEEEKEKVEAAEEEGDEHIQQESSCYESMVSLLCRSGSLNTAVDILRNYLQSSSSSQAAASKQRIFLLTNASLTAIITKFLTVFGYFKEAKKYLKLTQEILQKQVFQRYQASKENKSSSSIELFQKHQKLEIENLLEELDEYMTAMMSTVSSSDTATSVKSSGAMISETQLQRIYDSIQCYYYLLRKVFYFGFHENNCDFDNNSKMEKEQNSRDYLLLALKDKFGFNHLSFEQFIDKNILANVFPTKDKQMEILERIQKNSPLPETTESDLEKEISQILQEKDSQDQEQVGKGKDQSLQRFQFNFKKLFENLSKKNISDSSQSTTSTATSSTAVNTQQSDMNKSLEDYFAFLDEDDQKTMNRNKNNAQQPPNNSLSVLKRKEEDKDEIPLCLEIGSGNGDWVVGQAAADRFLFTEKQTVQKKPHFQKNRPLPTTPIQQQNDSNVPPKQEWRIKRNWIALELRYDRSNNILLKHFLEFSLLKQFYSSKSIGEESKNKSEVQNSLISPNNLSVCSGNAEIILNNYFPADSLSHVFINFPQPPDRITGGFQNKDQGKHLYTKEFLLVLLKLLKTRSYSSTENSNDNSAGLDYSKGKLTILSDNLLYVQLLANNILLLNNEIISKKRNDKKKQQQLLNSEDNDCIFVSPSFPEVENVRKTQEILPILSLTTSNQSPSIIIYRGDPGQECGHQVSVSSYFDRMWSLGQKKRRWFLHLEKTNFN